MELESIIQNAERAIARLSDQMESFAGRARMKYDLVTVGIFEGKVELLKSLGIMQERVAELQERIEDIRAEIKAESEGRDA